jgi:hypothetical protein
MRFRDAGRAVASPRKRHGDRSTDASAGGLAAQAREMPSTAKLFPMELRDAPWRSLCGYPP